MKAFHARRPLFNYRSIHYQIGIPLSLSLDPFDIAIIQSDLEFRSRSFVTRISGGPLEMGKRARSSFQLSFRPSHTIFASREKEGGREKEEEITALAQSFFQDAVVETEKNPRKLSSPPLSLHLTVISSSTSGI